ncbi:pentatricopeptide repeat-containing protein At4g01570 [Euphorbia lathyris]|uniref:pentatricopeptide repeat-containing protein At4g01570 n=1 Tax=Euphorbia lathyris TaxID=212925 RepID=UPI003313DFDB
MSRCTATVKELVQSCFLFGVKYPKFKSTIHRLRAGLFFSSSSYELENVLLVAYLTKNLSESGTRNLDPESIPLSEPLVLQILRQTSIHASRKLEFFKWCSFRHNYKHSACTYSHMFRTLCRAGYSDEVPLLLNLMKDDGVVVNSETFKFLLVAFIQLGNFEFVLEILGYMDLLGVNLLPRMYDSVLVALAKKNQVGVALSMFFKLVEASNDSKEEDSARNDVAVSFPGSIACNALLVALRKADMRVEFERVFEILREKQGFQLDTWGYNICIYAFGCWGDLGIALKLFKEMKEKSSRSGSFGPDLCTYNSLIRVLCLFGKVNDALIVYDELKVSGYEPDAFTYRILIQGCSKSYRMNDATRIFSEMHYNGFLPDTTVYNSFLDGMFKARKVKEACQLFERMVRDGVRASPWTYNILIAGLCKNGRSEAAYSLFCDLKKKGNFVDAITYSIVVLLLCREGQLEEALRLVEEMEERGFVVDLVTISTLLIEFHKQGRWDWTEKLLRHVRDGNLVPNVLKWQADLKSLLKHPQSRKKDFTSMFPSNGNVHEIMGSLRYPGFDDHVSDEEKNSSSAEIDQWSSSPHMDHLANHVISNDNHSQLFALVKGQRVQAKGSDSFDIDMMNTFLSIFLAKGKLSLACKLFEIFSDMGVDPATYTYNSIMSSFVKKGYFNEAWGVLNEMGEKVCPSDIATYNVIIQGLGKMGRADLASSVLDKLIKKGGYLDIVMYNTLINSLGKAGRIDEARMLFEQMKSSGIDPDVVTYNTMIEVHSKAGHLKDAYKFLKMMLDAGCLPNHVTDTTLDFLAKEIDKQRYQKASILRQKDE